MSITALGRFLPAGQRTDGPSLNGAANIINPWCDLRFLAIDCLGHFLVGVDVIDVVEHPAFWRARCYGGAVFLFPVVGGDEVK